MMDSGKMMKWDGRNKSRKRWAEEWEWHNGIHLKVRKRKVVPKDSEALSSALFNDLREPLMELFYNTKTFHYYSSLHKESNFIFLD